MSVPTLNQETIRLLDGLDALDHVVVLYMFEGLTLLADGSYCGIAKREGRWSLLICGALNAKWSIPAIDVIDMQRAG